MHPHLTQLPLPLETEEWRPVIGFHDYEVSSIGRIKRVTPGRNTYIGKLLRPAHLPSGYLYVGLWRGSSAEDCLIHRVVAAAFLGLPPVSRRWVHHRDGNPANNVVSNLEWVTPQENLCLAIASGRNKVPEALKGEANPMVKLTDAAVRQIRRLRGQVAQRELARRYGVSQRLIGLVQQRIVWRHI
jgi:hypothetical protein